MSLIHNKMESAIKRNDYNLKLVKITVQDISTLNKQWNINCLKQCVFLSISLSYIAWSSVLISKEYTRNLPVKITCAGD